MENSTKRPEFGDEFFPVFECDFEDEPCGDIQMLRIQEVDEEIEDGFGRTGFSITAEDWIGYDCFWSEKLQKWVYGLDDPSAA